ncbi:hypothetical protein BC938DRAFT_476035 [Jimgerdemannia flammicorona]|uniref:RING-type domain-containing protein n=1 Tax=Jimgerdemannia flammicorona TaxID=994334 RepID=A0A433QR09_9FUNG|nr:hypothetical protein BC938DRAFT_476035 [Jimgerdemannia flammicorona]
MTSWFKSFIGLLFLPVRSFQGNHPRRSTMTTSASFNQDDLLQCFVCYDPLRVPVLCPSCSKLACDACMRRWILKDKKCPHCRTALTIDKLIRARFVEEFQQQIAANKAKQAKEACPTHPHKTLTYYCSRCHTPVCGDCGILGAHREHATSIESVQSAYTSRVSHLKSNHILNARKVLQSFKDALAQLESNKSQLAKARKKAHDDIRKARDLMLQDLDRQWGTKDSALNVYYSDSGINYFAAIVISAQIRPLHDAVTLLRSVIASVETSSDQDPPAVLLKNYNDFIVSLEDAQKLNPDNFDAELGDHKLDMTHLVPAPQERWVLVRDFSSLRDTERIFYSPEMSMYGLKWRLKIYCTGRTHVDEGYLSVFIELVEGSDANEEEEYHYEIEMLHPTGYPRVTMINNGSSVVRKGHASVVKEYISKFGGQYMLWGYNEFCSLDLLTSESFLDTQNDSLSFSYSVRPANYLQMGKLQHRYFNRIFEVKLMWRVYFVRRYIRKLEDELRQLRSATGQQKNPQDITQDLANNSIPIDDGYIDMDANVLNHAVLERTCVRQGNFGDREVVESEPFNVCKSQDGKQWQSGDGPVKPEDREYDIREVKNIDKKQYDSGDVGDGKGKGKAMDLEEFAGYWDGGSETIWYPQVCHHLVLPTCRGAFCYCISTVIKSATHFLFTKKHNSLLKLAIVNSIIKKSDSTIKPPISNFADGGTTTKRNQYDPDEPVGDSSASPPPKRIRLRSSGKVADPLSSSPHGQLRAWYLMDDDEYMRNAVTDDDFDELLLMQQHLAHQQEEQVMPGKEA